MPIANSAITVDGDKFTGMTGFTSNSMKIPSNYGKCPSGSIITGVAAHSGANLDEISSFYCTPIENINDPTYIPDEITLANTGASTYYGVHHCPTGSAISPIINYSMSKNPSNAIGTLTFSCATPGDTKLKQVWDGLGYSWGAGGATTAFPSDVSNDGYWFLDGLGTNTFYPWGSGPPYVDSVIFTGQNYQSVFVPPVSSSSLQAANKPIITGKISTSSSSSQAANKPIITGKISTSSSSSQAASKPTITGKISTSSSSGTKSLSSSDKILSSISHYKLYILIAFIIIVVIAVVIEVRKPHTPKRY